MTTTTLYQYDTKTGEFLHPRPAQTRPNGDPILDVIGATPTPPPADIPAKHVARWTSTVWEVVEDHRQKKDERGRVIEGSGTPYWKGTDTWQSAANYFEELGPLPADALLEKPEKPLSVAQTEKRTEIAHGYDAALTAAITMPSDNPSPMSVAVETSALLAIDPDAVDSIKEVLNTRRAELLAEVNAAASVAQVEAITVSYPV